MAARTDKVIFSYTGKVENGQIKIYSRETMRKDAADFFEGEEIEFTIQKKKKKRSNRQVRYYWGVVVALVREELREKWGKQFEPQEVHEFLKMKFNSEMVVDEDTGEVFTVPISITKLSTREMMDYIERVRQWTIELFDLHIPEPGEQREFRFTK